MKLYYSTEDQPLIPQEELPAIYRAAEAMLPTITAKDIRALALDFEVQYPQISGAPNELKKRCLDWSEIVGWGLRVADSFGHTALVERILAHVQSDAAFEFYLAESFLVFAFEVESGTLNTRNYRLNAISPTLEHYILEVLHRRLETTTCPREWWAVAFLMNRVAAWLPLSPSADTYLAQEEAVALINAVERRQLFNPVTTLPCLQAVAEIRAKRQQIEHYWSVKDHLPEYLAHMPKLPIVPEPFSETPPSTSEEDTDPPPP